MYNNYDYRVRPKVCVSDPIPSRNRKQHQSVIASHYSHSSPLSLSHKAQLGKPSGETVRPCINGDSVRKGRNGVRKEDWGGVGVKGEGMVGVMVKKKSVGITRRREDALRGEVSESQRNDATCRFPHVLTLPPLVSYTLHIFSVYIHVHVYTCTIMYSDYMYTNL